MVGLVLLLLVGSAAGVWWAAKVRAARARAQWKGQAVQRLVGLSMSNEEVHVELEQLKAEPHGSPNFRWTSDHVLMMTNGEYIIYASRHGANSGFVDHLFLGHGSDGRWLYSTYHFCNSMCGVLGEDPPGSITEFAGRFFAREFDGRSDECLQHTWPVKE
jgi:hypothetical protein